MVELRTDGNGWHFLQSDRRLRWGSEEVVKVGKTITVDCQPVLCEQGLHWSSKALDALRYAPGPIACRIIGGGPVVHGDDKSAGTERTALAMVDATELLDQFARACALSVVHLWDTPDVVMEFLLGDQTKRAAAGAAAWAAAGDAAGAAARAAARAAAGAAAWGAAWDEGWAAANDVLEDALYDLMEVDDEMPRN